MGAQTPHPGPSRCLASQGIRLGKDGEARVEGAGSPGPPSVRPSHIHVQESSERRFLFPRGALCRKGAELGHVHFRSKSSCGNNCL